MGVELGALQGTGPGGRIVKADVEAAAGGRPTRREEAPAKEEGARRAGAEQEAAPKDAAAPELAQGRRRDTEQDLTRLQKTIARRMAESKATAPTSLLTVDRHGGGRRAAQAAQGRGRPTSPRAVLQRLRHQGERARAARLPARQRRLPRRQVRALLARQRRHGGGGPGRARRPDRVRRRPKSLGHIARESRALAERVRAGAITPPELSGGTFTVSNLGMFGSRASRRDQPAAGGDPRRRRARAAPVVRDRESRCAP